MSAESWGRRPRDWAALAEPSNEPVFAAVLDRLNVDTGTHLLDLACGSGYAAAMAAARGAAVTGLDITPELLEIARERVPAVTFVRGTIDELPFEHDSFDVVTAFSALQFAEDPGGAAAEARRVLRPGGMIGVAGFAEAERNESTALHLALEPLRATGPNTHAPYALSSEAGLRAVLEHAGFAHIELGEVPVSWAHPDVDRAVRAVLASGGGAMAIEAAGETAAREVLEAAIQPFVAADGSVAMRNVFRWAVASCSS